MSAITEVTHDSRTMSEFSRNLNQTQTPISNTGSHAGSKLTDNSLSIKTSQNLEYNEQRQPSVSLEEKGIDSNKFMITMNIDKIEEESESNLHETQGSNSARVSEVMTSMEFRNG